MPATISSSKRIQIVDALRGFALFGIIIAHMNNQYYAGMPPPGHETMAVKNGVDSFLQVFHDIFIVGKFYTIFSFLFGLSFGIQLLNARAKNKPFVLRFGWRLVVLFLIGFINHIHYRGDILVIYAVLGFFLLLFHRASNKVLLVCAFFFILNLPGTIFKTIQYADSIGKPAVVTNGPPGMPAGIDFKKVQAEATAYFSIIKKGEYSKIIASNINKGFEDKLLFQLFSGRLFVTMGLFILGLYVARRRIFENLLEHLKGIKRWMWLCTGVSLATILMFAVFGEKIFTTPGLLSIFAMFMGEAFSPALSMIYVGCFILLFQRERWQHRLSGLVPLGRMGLTTYLLQTVMGVLVFYGYGLNLLDVIGHSISYIIGIAFFIAQVYFSKWWMARHAYGPLEWLWRSLTYLKAQRWKRDQNEIVAATRVYEAVT